MKKTQRALRAATSLLVPHVLSEIVSEQVYATRRSSEATVTRDEKTASFFEGYRNGLGYAYRIVKDASAPFTKPARAASAPSPSPSPSPSRSSRGKKGEGQ